MGTLLGVGAADAQAVDLDVAASLQAAHGPPYGGPLGVARLLDSVDDPSEAGDRRGQRVPSTSRSTGGCSMVRSL